MRRKFKLLVTGGAGFIGSEFVRQGVGRGFLIIVLDKLTYAGDLQRLESVKSKFKFCYADICQFNKISAIMKKERPDAIIHFAAETHVDRSILNSTPFIETNVQGTLNLMDSARQWKILRFIHISTDEVYGDILKGTFSEEAPLRPNSPYAASKASADHLIKAYQRTFNFPAIIIRPSNNYGPWQYPEKFVPVIILKALKGQKVPIYAKGQNIREWLHVSDCVNGIFQVLQQGVIGETYNIGSDVKKKNIETAQAILKLLKKPEKLIVFVQDRPGHDIRYSVNCRKVHHLGWRPKISFSLGMKQTVSWYLQNQDWLEEKRGKLQKYWRLVYKKG